MTRYKRILFGAFALVIALSFAACTGINESGQASSEKQSVSSHAVSTKNLSAPETVKTAFDALAALDVEKFNQYLHYTDEVKGGIKYKNNVLFGSKIDEEDKKFIQSMFSKFSYKIDKSEEDGNHATVSVRITNRDLSDIIPRLVSAALANPSKANNNNLLIDVINKTEKTTTFSIKLSLIKEGETWKITMDKALANAICGGLISLG